MLPNRYYHIYNHANGDDNLFREKRNYAYFLEKYDKHISPIADTLAWCLLPNHFHLLVNFKSEDELSKTFPKFETLEKLDREHFLSKQFANLFSSYTQSFNKLYNRRGSLFLKNFKRIEILEPAYLRNLVLYIHLNPDKHGFSKSAAEWRWSSYHTFYSENTEKASALFGNTEEYYNQHHLKNFSLSDYLAIEEQIV